MASSAPAPRRGGNHSGQLQVMAARCASRIHGWFHGWDVYDRAVQHFFAHPSPNPPIFIEAGAYLGMSACFMSHLLLPSRTRQGLLCWTPGGLLSTNGQAGSQSRMSV